MKASTIRPLFAELRGQLVPIVEAIAAQPPADDACLRQHFPEAAQWAFGVDVIKRFGYDFNRGPAGQDASSVHDQVLAGRCAHHHPGERGRPGRGLFSTMHEAGHAMYEQGIAWHYEGTPLAGGTSAGVHESQSRLWENVVGRSRAFWELLLPQAAGGLPRATRPRAAGHVSTARSTRCSARSSAPRPTR